MSETSQQDLTFLQRCTAVRVSFGNLSFSKKLPKATVVTMVEATDEKAEEDSEIAPKRSDPNRFGASKKLLACDEAEAIRSEFSRLRKFVVDRTLPSPFGKAVYFVPNTLLGEVDAELSMAATVTIPRLGEALIAVLADVLRREEAALGPNFNLADYDTPQEIRNRLKVEFAYLTFGIPENLPDAIRMREAEKQGQRLMESVDAMQTLLRAEMAKLVDHAVDKLTGKNDGGKPKVFRNSLIGNIKEFLDLFSARNITSDTEMEALCAKASQLLDGVDPDDLREKEPTRDAVARGFAEIKAALDTMLVPKGSRSIMLDDEEPTVSAEAA